MMESQGLCAKSDPLLGETYVKEQRIFRSFQPQKVSPVCGHWLMLL
jgi:hypothetical protein